MYNPGELWPVVVARLILPMHARTDARTQSDTRNARKATHATPRGNATHLKVLKHRGVLQAHQDGHRRPVHRRHNRVRHRPRPRLHVIETHRGPSRSCLRTTRGRRHPTFQQQIVAAAADGVRVRLGGGGRLARRRFFGRVGGGRSRRRELAAVLAEEPVGRALHPRCLVGFFHARSRAVEHASKQTSERVRKKVSTQSKT